MITRKQNASWSIQNFFNEEIFFPRFLKITIQSKIPQVKQFDKTSNSSRDLFM